VWPKIIAEMDRCAIIMPGKTKVGRSYKYNIDMGK
jgi:hypothetical protein